MYPLQDDCDLKPVLKQEERQKRVSLLSLSGCFGRLIIIFPLMQILNFFYLQNLVTETYGSLIVMILNSLSLQAMRTDVVVSNGVLLGSVFSYVALPLLASTKFNYIIVVLSLMLSLGPKLPSRAKPLLSLPLYFLTVLLIDLIGLFLVTGSGIKVDPLVYGSINLIISVVSGSLIFLFIVSKTCKLPSSVWVDRLIKDDDTKNYLGVCLAVTVAVLVVSIVSDIFLLEFAKSFKGDLGVVVLAIGQMQIFSVAIFAVGLSLARINKSPPASGNFHPRVTVLIPAYNEEKTSAASIESIDRAAANYGGETEIVIVDDGSTDNTFHIAQESIRTCKRAKGVIVAGEHRGIGAALNLGLEKATGEIVFRLDADSTLSPNALTPLVRHFTDPNVGGVGTLIHPLNNGGLLHKLLMIEFTITFGYVRKALQGFDSIVCIAGAASAFRRDILLQLGGWAVMRNGEDADITVRVGRLGYRIIQDNSMVFAYTEAPRLFSEWHKQRIRWTTAFYYNNARNWSAMKALQGVRGTFAMPYRLIGGYSRPLGFLSFEFMVLSNLAIYLQHSANYAVSSAYLMIFTVASVIIATIVLANYRRLSYLKYILFYPVYKVIRAFVAMEVLLAILEQDRA